MQIPCLRKQRCKSQIPSQSQFRNINQKSRKPTCSLSLNLNVGQKFRLRNLKRKFSKLKFKRGIFGGARRTRGKTRKVDIKRRFGRFLRPKKVHFGFHPRKFNCKWRFPGLKSKGCFGFGWRGRRRVVNWDSDNSTPSHTFVQAMNTHAQRNSRRNTSSINADTSTPSTHSEDRTHSQAHLLPEQAQTNQVNPNHNYRYPYSLAPEDFPDTFYRLHRDENWRDTSDLPRSYSNNSFKSSTSLQATDSKSNNRRQIQKPIYNASEHGWSAKNTYTPVPPSPKQILMLVRGHFLERGVSSSSIFVPGVWNNRKASGVSLWDNLEDALEEGRRFGGAQIFPVEGDLFRRASAASTGGGSVVFCMEELLRRDSKLCMITRGRYGQAREKGEGGKKRRRNGLRGKAYLVAGVIPGTHNYPRTSPITATTDTNTTSQIRNEKNDINVVKNRRISSSPSSFIFNDIQEIPDSFDFETFERAQENPFIKSQSDSMGNGPSTHGEKTSERALLGWDLNVLHSNETKRDIRELRREHRNSKVMKMESISEDTIIVDAHTTLPTSSQQLSPAKTSSEIPRRQDSRNPMRKINSRAGITRAGTFGSKSSRGDLSNDLGLSSQAQSSHEFAMSSEKSGIDSSQDVNTATDASRDGYSSEDSLSPGSDIPAVAIKKRVLPPPNFDGENSSVSASNVRPAKFRNSSAQLKGDSGSTPNPVLRSSRAVEDEDMEWISEEDTEAANRGHMRPTPAANKIPMDYSKSRRPIRNRTPRNYGDSQKSVKRSSSNSNNNQELLDMDPAEWQLNNKESSTGSNTIPIHRNAVGKGTHGNDKINPCESNPHLKGTGPHHPLYNELSTMRRQSIQPKPDPILKLKRKPIPELENGEKVWAYKAVIAFGMRKFADASKQCYLIEWKEPWGPTWQPKGLTDRPLRDDWQKKKKLWDMQSRTKVGKKLTKEKKAEKILFEEDGYYLVDYTTDLRPEWIKKADVTEELTREFLQRKRKWRYEGHGLQSEYAEIGNEEEEEEEEEEEMEEEEEEGEEAEEEEENPSNGVQSDVDGGSSNDEQD
ncbi:0b28bfcb-800c-4637-8c6b-5a615c40c18e [Sclerotinia trifoliorum]|uniref:0b28bfcb-800c-4637-8c6b-5a615c40c18e n=1 Tax=Sclerotinia trifoliorum TaxID=28548 RepID=A0A8H2VUF9_9HELO|nr:0b28bfcb-800c-4637-8c6b-5a615c40c18e [Sclerotinia trifoliorum]